ncbi:MAG: HAMP domain-containing sensor histidine kinase [Chryseolinea sp.]
MKLLGRTNLYYFFFSIITYIIIAGSFYVVVEHLIYSEVEERLRVERLDFENFVSTNAWTEGSFFVEYKINLQRANDTLQPILAFKDTVLINRYNQQPVPFREYSFYSKIGGRPYRVSIRKSLIESITLLEYITITMLLSLSVGLALLFIFQRRISKVLWKPFFETLTKAKEFEVNDAKPLNLDQQDIFEFNELNSSLVKMTDKIARDYNNLKQFTENASHEIQTPLAMINSRVEELIQVKGLSTDQMRWIQDIYESTLRLSKMNYALLLLAKIDNGQFYGHDQINVSEMVEEKLASFEEIFNLKIIHLTYHKTGDLLLDMNTTLCDVLITNLINNAVKHNINPGKIGITLSLDQFVIENSGEPLSTDPASLFERFRKQNKASNSLGLGLAIVKKICDVHHLSIRYDWTGEVHRVVLSKR